MNHYTSIEDALLELRQGKMMILVDDERREQEGDLIMAAEKVTPEAINFMTKYARGLVCLTLTKKTVDRLRIPLMAERHKLPNQAAFTTSIEAAHGVTTGVSTHDRAHTIRVAVNPASTDQDISMPGHIFPLQARSGGVLERPGHTEGSTDLIRLAGLEPAAVICEIMKADGTMARTPDLFEFAEQHNIKIAAINDLIAYRLKNEKIITEVSAADVPLEHLDNFKIKVFAEHFSGIEHIALIRGELNKNHSTLVRIHSECLTGDVFGSQRCDCGWQLKQSLEQINQEGGVLIYMRQEGRGIGLGNKIKAYSLQSSGLDTVDANLKLGFLPDQRSYGVSAQILKELGVNQVRLITNNPQKIQDLERFGITILERVAIEASLTEKNMNYLRAKRDKLGHMLSL